MPVRTGGWTALRAFVFSVLGAGALWAAPVHAWELRGTKTLTALTADQQRIPLGTVRFDPQPSGQVAFQVEIDPAHLNDHFLSMKEFKCLEGPTELVCRVPYPYPQPGVVKPDDLAWLEHSLLFFYKLPTDFGAKLWNGLYFRFERTAQGLIGRPQAIDLNRISAPPDRPEVPPFGPALRDDIPGGARWVTSLLIE